MNIKKLKICLDNYNLITHVVEKDDCHTVSLLLKILFIFYDAWIESDVVQTKFIKTYKPEKVTVPSAKIFSYDKLYEVANYIPNAYRM